MRAADLLRQYRKSLNPPYTSNELVILLSLLFLLLVIPLTTISSRQARQLSIQAAATMSVTPNPVIAGGEFTITGSGFNPDQWGYFSTSCYGSFNVAVDSAGDLSFTRPAPIGPATCTFDVYQTEGKKQVLKATLTFEVVEMEKPGDINGDGVVNIFDASILASRWGTADPDADLNGNGVVDIFDASILALNWEG